MRLPGTLHLKNPSKPRLVKLYPTELVRRWKLSELVAKLGLSPATAASNQAQRNITNKAQSMNGLASAEMPPPFDWESIVRNCPFFLDALKNGGVDHEARGELLHRAQGTAAETAPESGW